MKIQPQHTICIQGGHVFDPSQQLDQIMNVYIENDTIVAIGEAPTGFKAESIIDASGKMVFPGFIDLNAFLAEPGFTQKGSIASETQAASRSGFTTLVSTPNTKPVVDSAALATWIQEKAKQAGFCRVLPTGALSAGLQGEQLSNMHGLKEGGCIALSQLEKPFKDSRVVKQCYHYAAGFDILAMVTPIDEALAQEGVMQEGMVSTKLGLAGISESAETCALTQHLILAKEAGVRLHISRVCSKAALDLILAAQDAGQQVTADVALGNLVFTDLNCLDYNSLMHVNPVYRSEADRQALLAAVNAGKLSICSNHRPHELAAKMAPFAASESGISVLDSFTSVLLNLVKQEELTLAAAISAVTSSPASMLGKTLGQLKIERKADLCIVDTDANVTLQETQLASKGSNNPWLNQTLTGKVVCTINAGHIVYSSSH